MNSHSAVHPGIPKHFIIMTYVTLQGRN